MEFSKKTREQVESCRFCWMCHHICPIGNATGLERNTARARALGLSLVARDAIPYSEDVISNVYECGLCGACVEDCITGLDPIMFTKEARLGAALDGKLPSYISSLLENLQNTGNIYAAAPMQDLPDLGKSDTLLFLGEDVRAHGSVKAAIALLQKAGVDFTVLKDEPTSGYSLDFLIGAAAETKNAMEACAKALVGYKKVICYDPADAKVFKREYKEWGIELAPEIVTFTEYIASLIESGKIMPKKQDMYFTPQDSFLLARDLDETEPVRTILSACGTIREMHLNRKETVMAGNLIMNTYMPKAMEAVAGKRWYNAETAKAETVVTVSPAEYTLLAKTKPENIGLMRIEEVVLQCL